MTHLQEIQVQAQIPEALAHLAQAQVELVALVAQALLVQEVQAQPQKPQEFQECHTMEILPMQNM